MAYPLQDVAILFGDSLTQLQDVRGNLQQRMSEVYERKLDVLNRGFAGYNSEGGRAIFDHVFARDDSSAGYAKVRLVTVWLGTNDCVLPPKPQANPLAQFEANLSFFLESLTSPTSPYAVARMPVSIVLITPGPCLPSMFPPSTYKFRTLAQHRIYRDAVLRIGANWKAKEKSDLNQSNWAIETLDAWSALENAAGGVGEELRPYFVDGTHLATEGYDVLWESLCEILLNRFKGRGLNWTDQRDLPMRAPSWDAVDWKSPSRIPKMLAEPPINTQQSSRGLRQYGSRDTVKRAGMGICWKDSEEVIDGERGRI